MVNSGCHGYGVELWIMAAIVVLMMMDDEGKELCGWKWVIGREALRELKKKLRL